MQTSRTVRQYIGMVLSPVPIVGLTSSSCVSGGAAAFQSAFLGSSRRGDKQRPGEGEGQKPLAMGSPVVIPSISRCSQKGVAWYRRWGALPVLKPAPAHLAAPRLQSAKAEEVPTLLPFSNS